MPHENDQSVLLDILEYASRVKNLVDKIDQDDFEDNIDYQDLIIRRLEIIGEATKRLSFDFRAAHSQIPWKDMAGLRDVLIHDYDEIDLLFVWRIATFYIPDLIARLQPLIIQSNRDS